MLQNQNLNRLIFNYIPAVYKNNNAGAYIEYYSFDPNSETLKRKHIRLNLIVKKLNNSQFRKTYINQLLNNINTKLSNGWSPFFESENARLYVNINDVFGFFISEKEKELRENTLRSYRSFVSIFLKWNNEQNGSKYTSTINPVTASRFMDYVYHERNVGQTTYNNILKMARAVFSWCVEKGYAKENPFLKIKPKAKREKRRVLIPADYRKKITDYLSQNNPHFLIVCKLVYYSLIRPNEIRQIRIGDIDLSAKVIRIDSEVAKNHKTRFATITEDIINDLKNINIDKYPKDFYLFSGDMKPANVPASEARFRKNWDKLRIKLDLPEEMQLYSFRDTGISEMLKSGIDQLSVMQHADHHSLDITSIYAKHADPNLTNIIYTKAPKF